MPLKHLNPDFNAVKVDIIAVSAVGANAADTWASEETNNLPFRTIYSGIEGAAIFVYEESQENGHASHPQDVGALPRSTAVQDFSEDTVVEVAVTDADTCRPLEACARKLLDCVVEHRARESRRHGIYFAGHGTGGLVIKQALCLALDEQEYNHILPYCFSVAFFGVPHRGSNILSEPAYAYSVQEVLGLTSPISADLRREISPSTSAHAVLNCMESDFVPCARRMQRIWTFVEGRETALEVHSTDRYGHEGVHQVDYPAT